MLLSFERIERLAIYQRDKTDMKHRDKQVGDSYIRHHATLNSGAGPFLTTCAIFHIVKELALNQNDLPFLNTSNPQINLNGLLIYFRNFVSYPIVKQ